MSSLSLGSRKVQLIRGTFFISLPRIWARNFNIQRGSEVRISLHDDVSLELSHQDGIQESDANGPL